MSSDCQAEHAPDAATRLAFPAVLERADSLAGQRQRRYLSLLLTILIANVGAAVLSQGGGALSPGAASRFEIISAVCLGIAIVVQVISHQAGWNRAWFEDRAVAEAARSASWRFMVRTPPFADPHLDPAEFSLVLERELPGGSSALAAQLAMLGRSAFEATPSMVRVRQAPWPERARVYARERLADQRQWYAAKARYNTRRERWFWLATLGSNLLAGVFLLLHLIHPEWNLIGVMTTLAAALIAWSSTKRFRELGESYRALAIELERIEGRLVRATSEAEFAQWAAAAEDMMTHEHWVWVARRVERHVGPPPLRGSTLTPLDKRGE